MKLQPDEEEEEQAPKPSAGLVAALAGRLAAAGRGDRASRPAIEFEVIDADPRRLRRLRVRPTGRRAVAAPDAAQPV